MYLSILVIPRITSQFMSRINLFCGLFNRMYMGGKIQTYDYKWSLIWFPWAKIFIYLSLFGIWKFQLKTMYIALKLENGFWIQIFVFGKIWVYNHILCYWCFTCAIKCYFPYMYLHLYVSKLSTIGLIEFLAVFIN